MSNAGTYIGDQGNPGSRGGGSYTIESTHQSCPRFKLWVCVFVDVFGVCLDECVCLCLGAEGEGEGGGEL